MNFCVIIILEVKAKLKGVFFMSINLGKNE